MTSPERRQPAKETPETDQSSELFERLKIKEQYLSQVKVLYKSGLLEHFASTPDHPKPKLGLTDILDKRHYLPTLKDLQDRLNNPETKELLETKAEQGFTKLLIVPFGLPFNTIIERYKHALLKIHQETGIKATDGSALDLDEDNPIYVWDDLMQADNPATPQNKQLEYYVKTYDASTKEQRGGKYKSELLKDNPSNAWQLLLIEDHPDLPAENHGRTIAGRKQLEANRSSKDYLNLIQTQEQYQGEQGLTPEANLTLWLAYLQQDHTAIDDYAGQGKANRLAGSYLSGLVPYFFWNRDDRLPFLDRDFPVDSDSYNGFRPAASI